MIVVRSSVQKLNIFPRIRISISHIIPILRKRENKPKVSILSGKVKMSRIGLKIALIIPSTNPARTNEDIFPVKLTSGIPVDSQIPSIPTMI